MAAGAKTPSEDLMGTLKAPAASSSVSRRRWQKLGGVESAGDPEGSWVWEVRRFSIFKSAASMHWRPAHLEGVERPHHPLHDLCIRVKA